MFAILRQDAANAIGEDSKLMVKDRSVIHGIRNRRNADNINISTRDLKRLPRNAANPEAIYKDTSTGNLIFRYRIDRTHDAKAVFIPGRNLISMVLLTFFKVKIRNNRR